MIKRIDNAAAAHGAAKYFRPFRRDVKGGRFA
jgi:hypothetical protein